MSHGIQGNGHGPGGGLPPGLAKQQLGIEREGSGKHPKVDDKKGPEVQQAQSPVDEAVAALDQAIKSLAASLQTDSFDGQAAPEGVTPASSGLTNVGNLQADTYTPAPTAAAAAPAPSPLDAEILDAKGGGGAGGGVIGSATYLSAKGGGGAGGGVIGL